MDGGDKEIYLERKMSTNLRFINSDGEAWTEGCY